MFYTCTHDFFEQPTKLGSLKNGCVLSKALVDPYHVKCTLTNSLKLHHDVAHIHFLSIIKKVAMGKPSDQYVQVIFLVKIFIRRCLKVHLF